MSGIRLARELVVWQMESSIMAFSDALEKGRTGYKSTKARAEARACACRS
jgi:hypothetical protein